MGKKGGAYAQYQNKLIEGVNYAKRKRTKQFY